MSTFNGQNFPMYVFGSETIAPPNDGTIANTASGDILEWRFATNNHPTQNSGGESFAANGSTFTFTDAAERRSDLPPAHGPYAQDAFGYPGYDVQRAGYGVGYGQHPQPAVALGSTQAPAQPTWHAPATPMMVVGSVEHLNFAPVFIVPRVHSQYPPQPYGASGHAPYPMDLGLAPAVQAPQPSNPPPLPRRSNAPTAPAQRYRKLVPCPPRTGSHAFPAAASTPLPEPTRTPTPARAPPRASGRVPYGGNSISFEEVKVPGGLSRKSEEGPPKKGKFNPTAEKHAWVQAGAKEMEAKAAKAAKVAKARERKRTPSPSPSPLPVPSPLPSPFPSRSPSADSPLPKAD